MTDETLSFSIIARDQASPAFRETARSASDLAGKMDIAARTGRVLDETLRKEVRAGDELSKSFGVSARAADILAKAERHLAGDAMAAKDELRGVKREADRLDGTTANVKVKINVDRSALSRLRGIFGGSGSSSDGGGGFLGRMLDPGGGSGSGGGSGGGLSSLASGGLTSPAGITAGVLGAALLGPGVIGAGLGGAVGLGGLGLTALIAKQAAAVIKLDQAQVKAAKSGPQLAAANRQLAADMKANSPFIAITADIKGLLAPLQQILTPFAKALDPIIRDFGKGLAGLGPQLTAMFQASLPFIQQFASVMLQSGKILIPAFTQALTEMVKSGALKLMTQGLVILVQGLAQFIVALGPGMKSSAMIFKDVATIIAAGLHGIGLTASWLANVVEDFAHRWRVQFDKLTAQLAGWRHETAVIFDGVRHDIAHIWDLIWNNTIGRLQRGIADDQRLMNTLRHNIASTFDTIRHDIASAWDTVWNNTVGRTQRGVADVVGWFGRLPGRALGALTGLGHSLGSFASRAMGEMWQGFKNVWSSVIHWFEGLPKMILHALGIKSPPSWAIDAGKHIMDGLNIGLGHGLGKLTSFTTDIGARVAGSLSGAVGAGGGAARWKPVALAAMGMLGIPSRDLGVVLSQMSTESGGDPTIVNRTDSNWLAGHPSVGLMQVIKGTYDAYAGPFRNTGPFEYGVSVSPLANIYAGLNYAIHRYGAGWTSVLGHGHGYAYGTSSAAPGWAWVGEQGPELVRFRGGEQVMPNGKAGGNTYNVTINVPPGANQAEAGRLFVSAIKQYEKRSGKSWRS